MNIKNIVVNLSAIVLCFLLKDANGHIDSPCPDIFQYSNNPQDGFGIIKVPSNYMKGEVTVAVTLLGEFGEGDGEGLKLVKNTSAAFEDAENGLKVEYKVTFPFTRGSPVIQRITIGNQSICSNVVESTTSSMTLKLTTQFSPSTWVSEYRFNNVCGISHVAKPEPLRRRKRIAQGAKTRPGEYPWLAAIYRISPDNSRIRELRCPGTLVSDRHVITAAHCAIGEKRLYIELGLFDRLKADDNEFILRQSRSINIHPDYNRRTFYADIAVVSFENVKDFTERISPACLWPFGPKIDSFVGKVVGWGWDEYEQQSNIPIQIRSTMVSHAVCLASHEAFQRLLTNTSFCAGGGSGAPCQQDSGTGFVVEKDERWYLRGVVIAGPRSGIVCSSEHYTVYTDIAVPHILSWLEVHLS